MAAISITAASVIGDLAASIDKVLGEASLTAGMVVRLDPANPAEVIKATNASAAGSLGIGVLLNGGGDGQPAKVQTSGDITIGGTVAVGAPYALGVDGAIIPVNDIAAGIFTTLIGVGLTATVLRLGIKAGGVAAAADVT